MPERILTDGSHGNASFRGADLLRVCRDPGRILVTMYGEEPPIDVDAPVDTHRYLRLSFVYH